MATIWNFPRLARWRPATPHFFLQHKLAPIDDPVAALAWLAPNAETTRDAASRGAKLANPDPAELIALNAEEIDWLAGFFEHVDARWLFEVIDGLFCGLITAPGLAKPSDGLSLIWGRSKSSPAEQHYENAIQEQYVTGLLTRIGTPSLSASRAAICTRPCWTARLTRQAPNAGPSAS